MLQQSSALIHSALSSPEVSVSVNELKWLGYDAYNMGCLCYKNDWFCDGVRLLSLACEELRQWCFAMEGDDDDDVLVRMEKVSVVSSIIGTIIYFS